MDCEVPNKVATLLDDKGFERTASDKSTSVLILVLLTGIQFKIPWSSQTKLD